MNVDIPPLDEGSMAAARKRHRNLTKPAGSLGRLESVSIRIAGMKRTVTPSLADPVNITAAGDHGVVTEGVSAFPQEVTTQMVTNLARGGAAVNALSRTIDAETLVVDLGVVDDYRDVDDVIDIAIDNGTRNITTGSAMTATQARRAVTAGRDVVRDYAADADIIGLGDMGIGNTTSSAAITAVLTGTDPERITGYGSGIDEAVYEHKVAVVEQAIETEPPNPDDGLDVLRSVGGFEIGGLAGIALEAASRRIPVVVDGFITGASVLVAAAIESRVTEYLLPSHLSAERGHALQYEKLGLEPLFNFDMRLGEGTGSVLGIGIYRGACAMLREMATFEEANVST